ncbi:hypothetical protein BIV57_05915 [Mangrovactinospora gilvigrisea]|uniref:Uncharacterized protein n=1 Tax=Mangrovactinospora gilvigrisea TaxID=1428644 RepID=A0A1J7CFF4_9ACTN|nr:hypothetical protein BIV57_05915 [Mangrovactinospora gilvigrisea]
MAAAVASQTSLPTEHRRGQRMERKLKLKLVLIPAVKWRFESSSPHLARGWPNSAEAAAVLVRLLLQTQYSPLIAGSSGR